MPIQPSKLLLIASVVAMLSLVPVKMLGQTDASSSQAKNWKDRAEYDLFDVITKDSNPRTKLEKLQQWELQYPNTEYSQQRQVLFLTTYVALNQPKEAVTIARRMLANDPNNFSALYYTMFYTRALTVNNPTPDLLDQGEKAAKAILENINTPPPSVTEEQWKNARVEVENVAHTTLGWIALQRQNWGVAEAELQKSLQINPNNGEVDFLMGTAIFSEKKVEKMPQELFYFARAATYDGTGGMNPELRKQVMALVQKEYKTYHGSDDGFNDLIAAAKSSAIPSSDLKIVDAATIAEQHASRLQQAGPLAPAETNPEMLTNSTVVAMAQAGVPSDVVLTKVKSAPCRFKLDADSLIALKKAHVPDDVIRAMIARNCIESMSGNAFPPSPAPPRQHSGTIQLGGR
jgi:tetratricopeptide (TPR) repeat protein